MKRVLFFSAAAFALAVVAVQAADSTKTTGYISDAMCGAKHVGTGAACVKKCIAGGEKPVFVDDAKKEVWAIDNPDSVKDYYGDHVTVTAKADESSKTVHIDSIAGAK